MCLYIESASFVICLSQSYLSTKSSTFPSSVGLPTEARRAQVGGERGIRTLDSFAGMHAFQACALDHYAISPSLAGLLFSYSLIFANWLSVEIARRRRIIRRRIVEVIRDKGLLSLISFLHLRLRLHLPRATRSNLL